MLYGVRFSNRSTIGFEMEGNQTSSIKWNDRLYHIQSRCDHRFDLSWSCSNGKKKKHRTIDQSFFRSSFRSISFEHYHRLLIHQVLIMIPKKMNRISKLLGHIYNWSMISSYVFLNHRIFNRIPPRDISIKNMFSMWGVGSDVFGMFICFLYLVTRSVR